MNREEIKKAVADAVQKMVEAQMKNLTDPLEADRPPADG